MTDTFTVFNEVDLDILRNLPEVQSAHTTYFQACVPESIKQKLQTSMGLDLSQVSSLPFRWMHGDTVPHVDRGQSSFEHTYLVYLTDGEGQFEVGDESYSMTAGSGFVFPEGTRHAVTGTNGTSRLLLGPMSESGFAVGAPSIVADGETDTVYISQSGGTIYYRINAGELSEVPAFPIGIFNNNASDPTEYILPVLFATDLTITNANQYFILSTDGIRIGSTTVKPDGTKYTITIDGVADYPGFIYNQNNSYIYVYNLYIRAINGSTLYSVAGTAGGWVGGSAYGTGGGINYITACSSDGPIPQHGGGIVGSDAAVGGQVLIIGCTSSGTIGNSGGGIAGRYAGGNAGNIDIRRCSSTGTIGGNGGGIVGISSGEDGICEIIRSFSTGTIGAYGGGIFGSSSGTNGSAVAVRCYSRGTIEEEGGGIYGSDVAIGTGEARANTCYSSGTFVTSNTGIFGTTTGTTFTEDCYVANGTWVDASAVAVLDMETYISVTVNQPYELREFGSSPYSLETLTGPSTLNTQYYQTIPAGTGTIAGVLFGVSPYSIVESNGPQTITINSTTGVISTTRDTSIGTYDFLIRTGSATQYSMTNFYITVEEALPEPPPSATSVLRGKGFDFETYNALQAGNSLVIERLQNTNLRFKSFEDFNKYRKAFAILKR